MEYDSTLYETLFQYKSFRGKIIGLLVQCVDKLIVTAQPKASISAFLGF